MRNDAGRRPNRRAHDAPHGWIRQDRPLGCEIAGRDQQPDGELRRERIHRIDRDVRNRRVGAREPLTGLDETRLDLDPIPRRVLARRLDRRNLDVHAEHRRMAEQRGRR